MARIDPEWTPDAKAERILFDMFWSPRGWRPDPRATPADFAYAKAAGYLFDPLSLSHDETIDRLLGVRSRLDPREVAQAFSDSLTSRRLDLRSALGSYGASLRLPDHDKQNVGRGFCGVCQSYVGDEPEDLGVLSFERFKWGGMRHDQPVYALFDLSRFEASRRPDKPISHEPLRRILDAAANAPADSRPGDLVKAIAPWVPGNVDQRRVVIACLGYAGILQPAGQPGFFDGYPTVREHPGGKNDWDYPVSWWRGRDGVNGQALAFYFPDLQAS